MTSHTTQSAEGGSSKQEESEVVEYKCLKDDHSSHTVSCKNGAVLELSCQGSPGVVSRRCPISNESDICVSLLDHRDCQLLSLPGAGSGAGAGNGNSDDLSITCECSLEYLSKPMMSDDSPTTINFGVMTRSVSHDFVSTWLSADDMSGGAVLSNLTVLFSTVGVSIMGGIVMFVSLLLDKQDEKKTLLKSAQQSSKSLPDSQSSYLMSSFLKPITPSLSSASQRLSFFKAKTEKPRHHRKAVVNQKHRVVGLEEEKQIEESLPLVMRPVPLFQKCKNEIKVYHRWLGVYYHYSPTYSRPLRVLSLWINIVTMLFIQSVLYNLADPDDGRCESQETMSDCLQMKSSLSNGPECLWKEDDGSGNADNVGAASASGACSYRPIHQDFNRVMFVALLSGLLSSPFSIFFQSLILFVLSAETRRTVNESDGAGAGSHHTVVRATSFRQRVQTKATMSTSLCEKVTLPTTLQEDFGSLLKKLRLYRSVLQENEKEEFQCEPSAPSPSLPPLSPHSPHLFPSFAPAFPPLPSLSPHLASFLSSLSPSVVQLLGELQMTILLPLKPWCKCLLHQRS
jgi:hypothetical protein